MRYHLSFSNIYNILVILFFIHFIIMPLNVVGSSDLSNQCVPKETNAIQSSAFWLSASLGGGKAFDTDRDDNYFGQLLYIDMSAHFRYHHAVISGGLQGGMLNEVHHLSLYYMTFGKSVYQTVWQEVIVSAGISRNQLAWSDDMSPASGVDATYPGIPLQFQYLFHFPAGIGMGIALDMNLNHRAIIFSFSLQAALGVWIL